MLTYWEPILIISAFTTQPHSHFIYSHFTLIRFRKLIHLVSLLSFLYFTLIAYYFSSAQQLLHYSSVSTLAFHFDNFIFKYADILRTCIKPPARLHTRLSHYIIGLIRKVFDYRAYIIMRKILLFIFGEFLFYRYNYFNLFLIISKMIQEPYFDIYYTSQNTSTCHMYEISMRFHTIY
jgi:hypothetical protein